MGRRPMMKNGDGSFGDDDIEKETGFLGGDIEKELKLYRSGSAPPTVEGSLSAVNGLFGPGRGGTAFSGKNGSGVFSEDGIRSDQDDLSYYYSKMKLNPRLIPALVPQEDWTASGRFNGGVGSSLGGIGDRMKTNNLTRPQENGGRAPFSMPPGFNSRKEECEENFGGLAEWGGDGPLVGLSGLAPGSKQKSYAEIFQNDMGRSTPVLSHPSRPTSRNAISENAEIFGFAEAELAHLRREMASPDPLRPNSNNECPPTYAAAVGGASLSRSNTPDPKLIARAPSPSLPPIGGGRNLSSEKRGVNSPVPFNGSVDIGAALSGMSLSANRMSDEEKHFPLKIEQQVNDLQNSLFNQHSYLKKADSGYLHMPSAQSAKKSYYDSNNGNGGFLDNTNSHMMADRQGEHNKFGNSYWKGASPSILDGGVLLSSQYQYGEAINSAYQNYGSSGYTMHPSMMVNQFGNGTHPPVLENVASASAMQAQFTDPSYLQYLRTVNDHSINRNYFGNIDLELQKAYLGSMISPQRSQYGVSIGSKSNSLSHQGYYSNSAFGVDMSYHGSPIVSPDMRFNSGMRNLSGGLPWHMNGGYNINENIASSMLEEFKSNKARCFELSEIAGHVVEFSADQYGSRFIQQKLETATAEEKNMVYEEIFPQTLTLMTDVFGNYVIQKFFEHGMEHQRRELANKLYGNVLSLSLQMYGCRVIQKAIEVVDMDQKIKMVGELDGHVMRCVHDQNGNHVIQKCIECVPQEAIQYIITTVYDQVVKLSTHPYGCRVIQRVLEHCEDPNTQNKVMEEVLGSVSMLAQDQYGNYVIQHVLEHGKPHERSTIIKELAGNIVQMSQQKFASNVVEKCLSFGDPSERQLLVTEMLGSTDENEPLQAMMKDQFANYVVQKVLETCEDQQRELILTRIKIHLNALKKYTFGKHIVARVEKLVAAGERRNAKQSPHIA